MNIMLALINQFLSSLAQDFIEEWTESTCVPPPWIIPEFSSSGLH